MMPEETLRESASTAVCPAKRFVTRSTMTGSGIAPTNYGGRRKGEGGNEGVVLRGNAEQLPSFAHSSHESVNVVDVIIDVEGRPRGRRHAQPAHQRLRAMMASANTDTVLVQDGCQVVRVNVAVCEWNDAGAVTARSVDRDTFDLGEPLDRQAGELLLVLGHLVHSQLLEIGDSGAQPDG